MALDVRTFVIRDGDESDLDTAALSTFLRSVDVKRMETAHAGDGWRVLVIYEDLRRQEEHVQIQQAIAAGLFLWRDREASCTGQSPYDLIPDEVLNTVATAAPTTIPELRALDASISSFDLTPYAEAIVGEVRRTMDDLADEAA